MNILFLTNNRVTFDLISALNKMNDLFVQVSSEDIKLEKISDKIDLIISYNYKYIINKEVVNYFSNKIINLHISLLPWNRGSDPNVWSFLCNTPKGVTIHLINDGVDKGDILYQKEIIFDDRCETLSTSYYKLHREVKNLFIENWNNIKSFSCISEKQAGIGSYHSGKDFKEINFILGEESWDIPILDLKKNYIKILKEKHNGN